MIEAIRAIKGPDFLFLYLSYAFAVIALFRIIVWIKDDSREDQIPRESEVTPLEVAILRNGSNLKAILHTTLFDLWQKKMITIREDSFVYSLSSTDSNQKLSRLEKEILKSLNTPKKPDSIIKDPVILEKLKNLIMPVKESLAQKKLIFSDDKIREISLIFKIFFIALLLPAIIKFFLGLSRNKPVFFLVMLFFAAGAFFIITYKNAIIRSSLGRKYLQELINHYKQTLKDGKTAAVFPDSVDPVLMTAIFGAGALLAFPQFNLYAQTFRPGSTGSFGDSISGGGCSGCSGGGGDGGGGGCGGCGGGD